MPEQDCFRKVDLHIHTPRSFCYVDHVMPEAELETSPDDIVKAAIEVGLDAIAITDHNSISAIDGVREVAKNYPLVVFPGIELTARGGHLLAIFDPLSPVAGVQSLIESLGFTKDEEGDGFFSTTLWLDEVSRIVEESGGLAIAAHIDRQPKGFVASQEQLNDKARIHSSPYLSALEITLPSERQRWNQGAVPYYSKRYACIQGSDAHAPEEMGRRPIYLKLPSLTLEGLRFVFSNFEGRIRFPEEME